MMDASSQAVRRAQLVLTGQAATREELLSLIRDLHQERRFGLARKLLERMRLYKEVAGDPKLRLWVGQKPVMQKRALANITD